MNKKKLPRCQEDTDYSMNCVEEGLTPLLDMFMIITIFTLLTLTYVQQLDTKGVELPGSPYSQCDVSPDLMVIAGDSAIIFNNTRIPYPSLSHTTTIIPYNDSLTHILERNKAAWEQAQQLDDILNYTQVAIIGDKNLPYSLIESTAATFKRANFKRISIALKEVK